MYFRQTRRIRAYIITPDTDFELHFGKPANKKRKLYNGMIQCNLMSYYQD